VVISTPFGSTAYFHSIARKDFEGGIGIAFSNTTKPTEHLVVDEKSTIEVEISRGHAVLVADNNPKVIEIIEGQKLIIKKSDQKAIVIEMDP